MRTGPTPSSRNTHRFETERLEMSLPTQDDAEAVFGLIGGSDRTEICATLIWDGPEEISETKKWIDDVNTMSFGDIGFHWVIRDPGGDLTGQPGGVMGAIGTRPRGMEGRADMGYWLGRPYWGRGIMSEAVAGLIEFGFTQLDYYKIEAEVFSHNQRGIRLVERAGMTWEGVIRQSHRKYGELVDTAVYGFLLEEWEARAENSRTESSGSMSQMGDKQPREIRF